MRLRVVLYAEGAGETGTTASGMPPAPGEPLVEDALGPGHVLVRRAIARARSLTESVISFESPLRTRRGLVARGSELHQQRTVRELLTWASSTRRPDLAVLLVDSDGDTARRSTMTGWVSGLPVDVAIGVAALEFEAWLISDIVAVSRVLGVTIQQPPDPESMKPREAKQRLTDWVAAARVDEKAARLEIASELDLDHLKSVSRSFEELLAALSGRRP